MTSKKIAKSGARAWKWVAIFALVVIIGGGVWLLTDSTSIKSMFASDLIESEQSAEVPADEQAAAQKEVDEIIAKVSKIILLPENEEPLVATIQNSELLAGQQAFYANAKNGDRLIVFSQKALIYRESENRLINVGPVYFDQEPITFDIRGEAELVDTLAASLSENENYKIVSTSNEINGSYDKNLIVNPNNRALAEFAESLDAEVVTELPVDEAATEAEIVIILGKPIE